MTRDSLAAVLVPRHLGDGIVLFDRRNWQTHILGPIAAELHDRLHQMAVPVTASVAARLLSDELDLAPDSADGKQLLDMFTGLGIIAG